MKYLQKSFTIAVSDRHTRRDEDQELRRYMATRPHEYENGGVMCLLCGLDERAKIHTVKSSLPAVPGNHYPGVDEFGGSEYGD